MQVKVNYRLIAITLIRQSARTFMEHLPEFFRHLWSLLQIWETFAVSFPRHLWSLLQIWETFAGKRRNRLRIEQEYSIKNRSARLQKRRESRLREKAWRKRKDRLVAKTRGKALRRVCANAIRKMHKRR